LECLPKDRGLWRERVPKDEHLLDSAKLSLLHGADTLPEKTLPIKPTS
jgi:hypothetical protein